jgi:mRNA interferase RelE/StbE
MILYHPLVTAKDIPSLDTTTKERIRRAIERKLTINPIIYGAPLHGVLKRLWKFRVGDWRVVYSIEKNNLKVWAIAHRKDVYKLIAKRMG